MKKMSKNRAFLDHEELYKATINQYINDEDGKKCFSDLDFKCSDDIVSVMRFIFTNGACIDFANAITDLTDWAIYEILWGDAFLDDPKELDVLKGIHRVIRHPNGRYFDASGWTDMESALKAFGAQDSSYKCMCEVDYGCTVFEVDYELIKKAAISLVPEGCIQAH
jgi:hypothetical protein